jgi:pimeloyl-ACP methyl ester carboxylesterase
MKKLARCSIITFLAIMLIGFGFLSTPAGANHQNHGPSIRPMIFVHGYTGSAYQFEWQAMRFASNGYPQAYLNAFEYDSVKYATDPTFRPQVYAALDQRIDAILQATGADKVELIGHSMGTGVSQTYLSTPGRAAKVAHYANLDGSGAASLPGGVPTLAVWAQFRMFPGPIPTIVGAQNVVAPKSPHNETCTSPETFAFMYKFFTGQDPETTAVLPDHDGRITLAGRAVLFPQNVGVAGATLEIYEINGETGARKHRHPEEIYQIDETGNFGPFKAKAGSYYEFNIARPGGNHHFYLEPRIRSDYFIRMNTSPVGTGLGMLMTRNPDQTNLIITRNREWLGDQNDGFNDILAINGINVVNAANAASNHMLVAYFICDWLSDHLNSLTPPIPVPALNTTFMSAVDLYLPGATPADATISIVSTPRGNCGTMHGINVPNWAIINESGSFSESITVQIDDYIQDRCDEKWDAHHGHDRR